MKHTKHLLLIYFMAVLLVSCGNSGATEVGTKTGDLKENAQQEAIRKEEEEAKQKSIDYLENVDVSDVNSAWQTNLIWFISRNFSR